MAAVEMDFISGGAKSADKISYDNTSSGLDASTVQGAIDTVNSNLSDTYDYSDEVHTLYFHKRGLAVYVNFYPNNYAMPSATSGITLTNIPQAIRPDFNLQFVCTDTSGVIVGRFNINSNGDVVFTGNGGTGNYRVLAQYLLTY